MASQCVILTRYRDDKAKISKDAKLKKQRKRIADMTRQEKLTSLKAEVEFLLKINAELRAVVGEDFDKECVEEDVE
ncbi:hypothetical protein ETB97_012614 [Aspergillus alliaceus]|uniref:Uncharacterized protein n=1 Tax=Petromyces alliaceus TaxID=209559 RepID=A0A8H6E6X1_PETAA|nr:hypothetical protein ETB97_012614 [Aspergillus burnettii]